MDATSQRSGLTIQALRVQAVNVPMQRPLQTSSGLVGTAPLVLIDLQTEEGLTGCSYVFCYTPITLDPMVRFLKELEGLIKGDPVAPLAITQKLEQKFCLLGTKGLVGMALAGIDMAAWDALAKSAQLPLARFLGGHVKPIPAYNSNGLGIIGSERVADEALALIDPGFGALKVRLGYPEVSTDVSVVRAVRGAVAENTLVMADFNQCLSVAEAQQRILHLDDEGLFWIEEPTRADDYTGHARIRSKARTPIQLGENCWGAHDMAKALAAGACDFFMPDAMKIGGITGWLRAAALAEPIGLPISSHLFPEVSAHLLAVTPTSHWLEYVDWANPILLEPLAIERGHAKISSAAGHGIAWNEDEVARYIV